MSLEQLPELTFPDYAVVLRPRPFGQKLAVPDGVHVHAAVLAFAEAPPPPPVVLRFVADANKYVVDGTMKDAATTAKLAEGGVLVPLDIVAKELGAGSITTRPRALRPSRRRTGRNELRAGSAEVLANGRKKALAQGAKTAPVAAGTTLLVPPGYFEEHLGARVVSLEKDKAVVIARRKFGDDAPSTVTGGPAAADAAAAAAAGGASLSPWPGGWETTISDMDIVVASDNSVNFNYDGEFGRLEGKVDGTRLNGRFVEDNGSRGEIVLTLGRENRTFAGQWRRTDIARRLLARLRGLAPLAGTKTPALYDRTAAAGVAEAAGFHLGRLVGHIDRRHGPQRRGRRSRQGRLRRHVRPHRREEWRAASSSGRFFEDNGNWGEFVFVPAKQPVRSRASGGA